MIQQIHTYEQLGEAFHSYLLKHFDEDEAVSLIETAERAPEVFEPYFGKKYESIYEIQDAGEVEELRKKIQLEPILKNIDRNEDPSYTETLRWYRNFVKSLTANATPIPVPGEQEETSTIVAENTEPPVEHNDADYAPDTEGVENQYNLTRKERNPEIRRKCIEYYKQLWHGRIHCICCGFDFGKAYGEIGEGYIEVHHLTPHHTFAGVHTVDPANDLIPLCSNCHSMIHRVKGQGECMTLKELKEHYKGIRYND